MLAIINKCLAKYQLPPEMPFFMICLPSFDLKDDKACSLSSPGIDFQLPSDYFQFMAFLESTVSSYLYYKVL